jgi:hypothetical protein
MSAYIVSGTGNHAEVKCNGNRIKLTPMSTLADPLYGFGEHSDSSMNLAYAILLHCCGDGAAKHFCEDFVGEFLLDKEAVPFKIETDAILEFVKQTSCVQYDAQEAVRNMKMI